MWKEIEAVRLAVHTFLPQLAGISVILMYENNHAALYITAGLTSRSPMMTTELRKPLHLLDANDINTSKAHYISSPANVCADRMSIHLDNDDWELDPVLFAELDSRFGPHIIDCLAYNKQHPPTSLQRGMARPNLRRCGRPTSPRVQDQACTHQNK
jgi:hypothetical protein